MSHVTNLIRDLEDSIRSRSNERRVETLRRVTDLFLRDASVYTDEHVDLFDIVISRLASAIEARARAELAERLADVPNAPPGVIRSLANDEIMVARPVLERSPRLNDGDLVSVAVARGRDHMLAISERTNLSETVTDVLLTQGDRIVTHAVAGNSTAKLSNMGIDTLVDRSRADETLQILLVQRIDLPDRHLSELVAIAKATAHKRLQESMPALDEATLLNVVEASAGAIEQRVGEASKPRDYTRALEVINQRAMTAEITEFDVADYAGKGLFEETVCVMTTMTHVSIPSIERMLVDVATDLLLILCKSQSWAWSTVKALIRLRGMPAPETFAFDRAFDTYDHLSVPTAQRVLRFLHVREVTTGRVGEAAAIKPQIRRNVR